MNSPHLRWPWHSAKEIDRGASPGPESSSGRELSSARGKPRLPLRFRVARVCLRVRPTEFARRASREQLANCLTSPCQATHDSTDWHIECSGRFPVAETLDCDQQHYCP